MQIISIAIIIAALRLSYYVNNFTNKCYIYKLTICMYHYEKKMNKEQKESLILNSL